MGEKEFLELCKEEIKKYILKKYILKKIDKTDSDFNIFMVWCCKTLQNNKALLSTTLPDGLYYECTYNGDKKEMYIDVYKKWENYSIDINS